MKHALRLLSAVGLLALAASPSFAAYPASVVGVWHGFANQTFVTVTITGQFGAAPCFQIVGTMTPVPSTINGYYCPATGGINWVRKTPATNDTWQTYDGNLAADAFIDRAGGTFGSLVPITGEFGWQLTR
jgi:hypothetical protein